jgi:drug/metabolite transporter (DMT)-like permease
MGGGDFFIVARYHALMKHLRKVQIFSVVLTVAGVVVYVLTLSGWGIAVAVAGVLIFMVTTIMSNMKSDEP